MPSARTQSTSEKEVRNIGRSAKERDVKAEAAQQVDHDSDNESDDSDHADEGKPPSKSTNSSSKPGSASQVLVPVPGKPNEPMVTKRTLQNRKAQREFRKRREARVKELEERCRRFDQMGLEANVELQRVARRLKDENEALRGLLIRLGYGNMLSSVLDGLNGDGFAQGYTGADLAASVWSRAQEMQQLPQPELDLSRRRSSSDKEQVPHASAIAIPVDQSFPPISMVADSVNPSLLSDAAQGKRSAAVAFKGESFDSQPQSKRQQFKAQPEVSRPPTSAAKPSNASDAVDTNSPTLLSLNLSSTNQPASNEQSMRQDQGAKVETPNTTLRSFLHGLEPLQRMVGQAGGLTGSAMLGSQPQSQSSQLRDFGMPGLTFGSGLPTGSGASNLFPMPTHQNDALLNPNPIPFAFNLSNPKSPPDQSWWNQMGGGMLSPEGSSLLDEKAQAVAQATAGQGAQSPFDLSAFLTGGITPGGGFNFGPSGVPNSSDPGGGAGYDSGKEMGDEKKPQNGKRTSEGQRNGGAPMTQAEHAQMFLRLLEAKVAKGGDESPYTSLGFQPPSHHHQYLQQQRQRQQSQRRQSSGGLPIGSSWMDNGEEARSDESTPPSGSQASQMMSPPKLSPSNVYSRLAEHPAFLSTNAQELEELVDAISNGRSNSGSTGSLAQSTFASPMFGITPGIYQTGQPQRQQSRKQSLSGYAGGDNGVEVDEKAVNRVLGMLDRKQNMLGNNL
ncbi:hypothetical protein IE53DRAFT_362875 [Violaceomyces palustris]|uniref:Uncharacterized protein n=1 Tax=Violaceomyces palustris TaxID=1673888 RepID=A0ACD0NVH1_9BASI|nr:hypothetical protein IE53DRAFT_362875 [Violaceomyces palustris]